MDAASLFRSKLVSVDEAVAHVPSGSRLFLGSGCAEPQTLVRGLCRQSGRLADIEVCSLLTLGIADYVQEQFLGHFRHNAYFIGANVRDAVRQGRADYTPVFLSEIPELIRSGQQRIDVALLQLSPPDRHGNCSMGIHVDVQQAAIETARVVIAEINPNMPHTNGQSSVPLSKIDFCVEVHTPLLELPYSPEPDETAMEIGMHVARLVENGSCLQLGIGHIPNAVARFLDERRHLGLHTEMFSDGVLGLLEAGNVDNSQKAVLPGKTVVSFTMGTRRLYDYVDGNASVEYYPSDFVNNPRVICRNDKTVAINSALQVDLTGQVCADSLGYDFYSGIGGHVDFMRGAAMSRGGKPIIALRSTAKGGRLSRIVPHLDEGAGVVTSRGDVHYVVTEYGTAYLHGKTIRERAMALVGVAHPDFRKDLLDFVKAKHYAFFEGSALAHALDPYPVAWERRTAFGEEEMLVRPLRPGDVTRLRDFFYSHTMETIYHRYFTVKKHLSHEEARHLCSVDYRQRMAFGVFRGEGEAARLVAVGRYDLNPRSGLAETALVVGESWRGRGIGTALLKLLLEYAHGQGIRGIRAEILPGNQAMVRLHRTLGHDVRWDTAAKLYEIRHVFDEAGAPAAREGTALEAPDSNGPEGGAAHDDRPEAAAPRPRAEGPPEARAA
ncbi:MAG: GNAT family N-acetyltransferase [bacterium]